MNYNEFFDNLALTGGRNDKISLLLTKKEDLLLKKICELALDPFTQFYQRKIPKYQPNTFPIGDNLDWAIQELIEQLASRKITGNNAISHLTYILENISENNAKVIERIIKKDLKCGVNTSTVNKVWKNLIPEFPCMLCSPFEQRLIDKIKFPAIAQKKEDGMRFNAIVKDGKVEFRSRNGKEITLLGSLEQEFIDLAYGGNIVFDGELLVYDTMETDSNGKICDRQTGNGVISSLTKYNDKLNNMESNLCTLETKLKKLQQELGMFQGI
jgi:hypothetical protein